VQVIDIGSKKPSINISLPYVTEFSSFHMISNENPLDIKMSFPDFTGVSGVNTVSSLILPFG